MLAGWGEEEKPELDGCECLERWKNSNEESFSDELVIWQFTMARGHVGGGVLGFKEKKREQCLFQEFMMVTWGAVRLSWLKRKRV